MTVETRANEGGRSKGPGQTGQGYCDSLVSILNPKATRTTHFVFIFFMYDLFNSCVTGKNPESSLSKHTMLAAPTKMNSKTLTHG